MTTLFHILTASWQLYLDVAIFMLFGFFIAGLLYVFVSPDKIAAYLGNGKIKPVVLSALMGIPIPLCSCGVMPVAAGLKKQGANSGASLSFMIATPESGVDSIAVSWAMLDPVMTVFRPVAAFVTAVSTGIVQNFLGTEQSDRPSAAPLHSTGTRGCRCGNQCGVSHDAPAGKAISPASPPSLISRFQKGMVYAYGELLQDVAKPFIAGILIAGAITFFFPEDITAWANEHGILSMLIMLAAGIPMYVCATSSTPIAAALILKGLNPGAALVFLLAGPATNAATINLVRTIFNTRALLIYLSMISIMSLIMGAGVDMVYRLSGIQARAMAGQAAELFPAGVHLTAAAVLSGLIVYSLIVHAGHRHHSPPP